VSQLESVILREIGAISRCIQTRTDSRFKNAGLQKGQFIFVTRICENPGITLVDLTRMLRVDKTTTTKAVQKLLEAGFIEKRKDTDDMRLWNLYPLQKARELYPSIIAEENRNIRICFSAMTEKDKETVNFLVGKMRENLETPSRNYLLTGEDSND
jgi:DNA-binding MarR family transcriptional regulator